MPAVLGLSTYRWNNNIKSILLLLMFPLLLMALTAGIAYLAGYAYLDPRTNTIDPYVFISMHMPSVLNTGKPEDFALSVLYAWWPLITGACAVWVLIGFLFNDAIIHAATGAKSVTRVEQPKLYNMLENLCISRGMKTPNLYIIDGDELNAYASGIDEKSYAITVTRGLLDHLNDHEVEAVLGHELTHIINRDCRLMIVTIVFVGMISFAAQMMWRSMQFAAYGRSNNREGGGGGTFIFVLLASLMMAVGYVLALILRLAISRKREYLADAGSVVLTKDPEALISALRKISQNCDVPHVPSEVRQMFIENPPSALDFGGLFATHPPIADRIRVLQQLGGLPAEGKSVIPDSRA